MDQLHQRRVQSYLVLQIATTYPTSDRCSEHFFWFIHSSILLYVLGIRHSGYRQRWRHGSITFAEKVAQGLGQNGCDIQRPSSCMASTSVRRTGFALSRQLFLLMLLLRCCSAREFVGNVAGHAQVSSFLEDDAEFAFLGFAKGHWELCDFLFLFTMDTRSHVAAVKFF